MAKEEKVLRSYSPEGGLNPHVAAQVKFNNCPSVFAIVDEYCLEPDCECNISRPDPFSFPRDLISIAA